MSCPSFLSRPLRCLGAIIGVLSLAVALGGCSAIKLGYSTLPEVGYWWLDGYADFDDGQRQRVREDIARLHAWHRSTELPRLVQLLQQLEQLAPTNLSATQACAFEAPFVDRIVTLRERAEPALVSNGLALRPQQLRHLERKFAQKNGEYTKEWVEPTPAERTAKRTKDLLERAEQIYGRLEEPQRAALAQVLQASPWDPARVLAERRRRQQDTLAVLRRLTAQPAVSLQDARVAMRDLLDRYGASPDPTYRSYLDAVRQEGCRLASAVHNSTTAAQREFAARRLRAWQRDLSELAAQQ